MAILTNDVAAFGMTNGRTFDFSVWIHATIERDGADDVVSAYQHVYTSELIPEIVRGSKRVVDWWMAQTQDFRTGVLQNEGLWDTEYPEIQVRRRRRWDCQRLY